MDGRIVIRNAFLPRVGARATVVLSGRHVTEVAPAGRAVEGRPGDWDVDADGRLVTPGQVDLHGHLGLGALLRSAGLPGRAPPTLADLRAEVLHRAEERLVPARLEPLVRAGALAALRAGTTCVFDVLRGAGGAAEELLEAEARALSSTGLRAAVAYGARGGPGRPGGADEVLAAVAFAGRQAEHARLRGTIGLGTLTDLSDDALDAAAEHAHRLGLQACAGEDEGDLAHAFARWGRRPIEVLAESGLLGPRSVVAHGGVAVHAEAVALADAGATLAVTPRAAMFRGLPIAPLAAFAGLGVQVAFGTDGLFPDPAGEAAAAAMLLRHAERSARAGQGLAGRVAWPAAARAASTLFGERIGTLEAGALADVVVLDWRPPVPLPEALDGDLAILWAGAPAAWVIVDGEVRLREGRLLGGDEAEIAARAREAAGALLGAGPEGRSQDGAV
jgi:cytosine/adenosine deaminase-related metal-dependent hydrolase